MKSPNIYSNSYPLGLGTLRLCEDIADRDLAVEKGTELVLHALNSGVSYIDTSYSYVNGVSHAAIKNALKATHKPYTVTIKSQYFSDRTEKGAMLRAELSLAELGLDYAEYFVVWSIRSFDEFSAIMQKGGIYDAAVRLKKDDIIGHICASLHTSAEDSLKIMRECVFEGYTISFSPLNCVDMKSVTRYAAENNIDLVAMNPLAGGIIPKNPDYFSVLRSESDATVNIAALRFVASQPPIKVTLIGAKSIAEFDEAMSAFTEPDGEKETRSEKGYASITQMKSFCTNCGYCEPCPKNIPIRKIMQSQNMRLFSKYGRRDTDKQILRHLDLQFGYIPETSKNPCVKCKKCETQCTQRLAIIATIADMHDKFADYGYSLEYRKEQIRKIFTGNNYKKIALWPSGGMADLFLKYYREFFGEPSFDVCFINGNKAKCNEEQSIYDPESLAKLQPDVILVCSHQYADAIIEEIGELGIVTADVVRLFGESELSWL